MKRLLWVSLCVLSTFALAQTPTVEDPTLPVPPKPAPEVSKEEKKTTFGTTSDAEARKLAQNLNSAVIALRELLNADADNFRGMMSLTSLDDLRRGTKTQQQLLLSEYRTPWLNAQSVKPEDHQRVSLENLFEKQVLRQGLVWNLKETTKSVENIAKVQDRWLIDLQVRNRIAFYAHFLHAARERIDNATNFPADNYRAMVDRITATQNALIEATHSLEAFYQAYEADGYGAGYHADWFDAIEVSFGVSSPKVGVYQADANNAFSTYLPGDSDKAIAIE